MQDHYQILIHDQVIYDWDHLHRRPCHSPCVLVFTVVQTIETTSFENTLIWDHIRDHIHLRPHSFWDHIHFETTFILRLHSFWDHTHTFILRHTEVKLFWFTVNQIFVIYLVLLCGNWSFARWLHLKFYKVTPFCVQGWLTLGVNAPAL